MCFYRLVCRDITVTECYVGSTTDAVDRRYKHKSRCTNEKDKKYNLSVYKFIRDHGSWNNWQLLVIEQLAMADDIATALRERHWTEHFKATLNKQVQGRTKAEWHADHVEEVAAYGAKYHADHREEDNKRFAAYNKANKAHSQEKHDCPCGGKHTTANQRSHFKSQRHCAYLAALPAV
jgi:hypothetical protein